MKAPFSGGCMCGAIRYACHAEPKFQLICQCTHCQKITGTGHALQFAVDMEKTTVTGDVKTFTLISDAGNPVQSAFCGECGNPIYKVTSRIPGAFVFHAATLDDPATFKPTFHVYARSAQPWDRIDPALEDRG